MFEPLMPAILAAALVAFVVTVLLALKSLKDFTRTGPQLKLEVSRYYRGDLAKSIVRLMVWTWFFAFSLALVGSMACLAVEIIGAVRFDLAAFVGASISSTIIVTGYLFSHNLLYLPANIEASSHYRMSRFYPVWEMLNPTRLKIAGGLLVTVPGVLWGVAAFMSAIRSAWPQALVFAGLGCALIGGLLLPRRREPQAVMASSSHGAMNVLMIGSDSLRADRVNGSYRRDLAPFIDGLAKRGVHFKNCFVPCARTAPSLASMMTGRWPHRHGIRDNFVAGEECAMNGAPSLAAILRSKGYQTIALSDWCGADFGKLHFGFEQRDLPEDQWNIRYLLRQGPKDIRLFLSLFVRNRLGKRFLPELYYLAGVPTTQLLGRDARAAISRAASSDRPFFINVFMSTTHGPFGSEYPYYTMYSGRDYAGCSKFTMSGLNEPSEVVLQQGYTKDKFDLEQIINLYDGCVRNFDDEVRKIVKHLDDCGLAENTMLVIYSDHGMEFFERQTWGQGNSVIVDDSARIPLIIVAPSGARGLEITELTRTVDLAPTILELTGYAQSPELFDGESLAGVIRGKATMPEMHAYYETGIWFTKIPGLSDDHLHYPDLLDLLEVPDKAAATIGIKEHLRQDIINAKDRAIRLGKWKLVRLAMCGGPEWLLYDTSRDPCCTQPVGEAFPEILERLRTRGAEFWIG